VSFERLDEIKRRNERRLGLYDFLLTVLTVPPASTTQAEAEAKAELGADDPAYAAKRRKLTLIMLCASVVIVVIAAILVALRFGLL
jgi:hypothetical protein